MYNNVFDKLGNASYNLDNIRELIPKQQRSIIPVTGADATPQLELKALPLHQSAAKEWLPPH